MTRWTHNAELAAAKAAVVQPPQLVFFTRYRCVVLGKVGENPQVVRQVVERFFIENAPAK